MNKDNAANRSALIRRSLIISICGILGSGCSERPTSSSVEQLHRTTYQKGRAPLIASPPAKEFGKSKPISPSAGSNGTPAYSFDPGGIYTFQWSGGEGNKADLSSTRWDTKQRQRVIVWSAQTLNTGNFQTRLPNLKALQGPFELHVSTYFDHPACYTVGPFEWNSCYYSSCRGALAHSNFEVHKNFLPPRGTTILAAWNSDALDECRQAVASQGGDPMSCVIVKKCSAGRGGWASSEAFQVQREAVKSLGAVNEAGSSSRPRN